MTIGLGHYLAVSAILFTNMVNRVNDTVVDFPKAD